MTVWWMSTQIRQFHIIDLVKWVSLNPASIKLIYSIIMSTAVIKTVLYADQGLKVQYVYAVLNRQCFC